MKILIFALLPCLLLQPLHSTEITGALIVHGKGMATFISFQAYPYLEDGELTLQDIVQEVNKFISEIEFGRPPLFVDSGLDLKTRAFFKEKKDITAIEFFTVAAEKFNVDIIFSDKFVAVRSATKISQRVQSVCPFVIIMNR